VESKEEFFTTINELIKFHPRRSEIGGDDMIKILDAENHIPGLFERLMIIAYQKEAPQYSWLIEKEDYKKFQEKFVALSKDYAARFVGSLFRKSHVYDFGISLQHNKNKTRLELVLQSLGFNANNKMPDFPREKWFTNEIESDYMNQWAIDAVNARKAQEISKGSGVTVAILDSGLDPFNSLFENAAVPGFSFLERTGPPWAAEEHSTIDWGFHGTVTASTVLMIAPECSIMPVRIFDAETQNDPVYDYWMYELMAAGIYYAVHHGAHVIQIGAALKSTEPVVTEAVNYAYYKNVVICTSAGNIPRSFFGMSTEDVMYRAFDNEVILVGGVEKNEEGIRPWPHTVPGSMMDIAAPSQDVFIIVPVYIEGIKNYYVAGTSLSSPIASGAVALMRSAARPSKELLKQPGAFCRLISKCLHKTARLDILGLVEPNDVVGNGLIDVYSAVTMIQQELKK